MSYKKQQEQEQHKLNKTLKTVLKENSDLSYKTK